METPNLDYPYLPIAQAALMANMHPQTLRQYDRLGLVKPSRTIGQTRRYTLRNVAQLIEVQKLSNEGVSLNAIARIIQLENQVVSLKHELQEVQQLAQRLADNQPGARVFAVGDGETVILPNGRRPRRSTAVVLWRQR